MTNGHDCLYRTIVLHDSQVMLRIFVSLRWQRTYLTNLDADLQLSFICMAINHHMNEEISRSIFEKSANFESHEQE